MEIVDAKTYRIHAHRYDGRIDEARGHKGSLRRAKSGNLSAPGNHSATRARMLIYKITSNLCYTIEQWDIHEAWTVLVKTQCVRDDTMS